MVDTGTKPVIKALKSTYPKPSKIFVATLPQTLQALHNAPDRPICLVLIRLLGGIFITISVNYNKCHLIPTTMLGERHVNYFYQLKRFYVMRYKCDREPRIELKLMIKKADDTRSVWSNSKLAQNTHSFKCWFSGCPKEEYYLIINYHFFSLSKNDF